MPEANPHREVRRAAAGCRRTRQRGTGDGAMARPVLKSRPDGTGLRAALAPRWGAADDEAAGYPLALTVSGTRNA